MNLIAFDASTQNLSLSIMVGGKTVVNYNRKLRFASSRLVFYIDKCMKKAKLEFKNIGAIVVGSGPGSFTGLRVSFSVAKALSVALGKPVINPGSFSSMALPFIKDKAKIAVIGDARKNLIYGVSFRVKGGKLIKEGKEKLYPLEEFIRGKGDYFFITSDIHLREEALKLFPGMDFLQKPVYPMAKYLLLQGVEYYNKKKFTGLGKLEPLYIHPKTCQIRKPELPK